jgi:hypothetical protein
LLWDMKLRELIELAEKGEKGKWANLIK